MWALRTQYLLTFAVMGCVLPYLPVFFRSRGMQQTEVGWAFAIASGAVLLAPVLLTLLADTRFDARALIVLALAVAGAALIGLSLAHTLIMLLIWYALHALTLTPVLPLQDGVLFGVQERLRREHQLTPLAYHRVRVWGTVGFIVPSLGLFWLLRAGVGIEIVLISGAVCAIMAAVNARLLPDPRPRPRPRLFSAAGSPPDLHDPAVELAGPQRLPTLSALRALRQPHVLVFCCATFLLSAATAPYYAFYPIYLTETVGIDPAWIGMIANVGVAIEIFFMLGFGWLRQRLGLKRLVVLGFLATAARFALLAAAPTVVIAVATQVFHGMMVLMIAVVPPVFLNEHAEPRFRHSMQGLYTMLVVGIARIAGNLLAGPIAQQSLLALFWLAAATSLAAALLVAVAFHQPRPLATKNAATPAGHGV